MFHIWRAIRPVAVALVFLLPTCHAVLQIVPGATWTADNGLHVQAHGAGAIRVDDTFYIIGEDKTNGSAFQNINCYSSKDLVQWHYEGALLSRTASGDLGPSRVIERPKVIYNDKTNKYVLWMHVDSSNYGEAKRTSGASSRFRFRAGTWACSKTTTARPICFQKTYVKKTKKQKQHLTGYRQRQNGLRINKLTDDYLGIQGSNSTYLWPDRVEAPAMIKHKGRYYMFGSHLSGWDPNDNIVSSSTDLTKGWTAWASFADAGSKTYSSQTNYVLHFGNDKIMYMGDRWVSSNLMASTYVWLPLAIDGTDNVTMKNHDAWIPNAQLPQQPWQTAAETAYAATAGTYGGSARSVGCSACTGGRAAGYLGGPDSGTVTVDTASRVQGLSTLVLHYSVSEAKGRMGSVSVNGEKAVTVQFLPGRGSGNTGNSVLTVALRAGNNTVQVGGDGTGSYGPDVDRVVIPVE